MKKIIRKILLILILIVLIFAGLKVYKFISKNEEVTEGNNELNVPENIENEPPIEVIPEKTVQIYSGNERPIAVMLDNSKAAWPQAGLNDAYLVYEIIVEGRRNKINGII